MGRLSLGPASEWGLQVGMASYLVWGLEVGTERYPERGTQPRQWRIRPRGRGVRRGALTPGVPVTLREQNRRALQEERSGP